VRDYSPGNADERNCGRDWSRAFLGWSGVNWRGNGLELQHQPQAGRPRDSQMYMTAFSALLERGEDRVAMVDPTSSRTGVSACRRCPSRQLESTNTPASLHHLERMPRSRRHQEGLATSASLTSKSPLLAPEPGLDPSKRSTCSADAHLPRP
jgi:hypothetical protein